jgi:hypothetical protein
MSEQASEGGGFGCLGVIVWITLMWAIFCGVTVNGTHYGMSCSCDDGVRIDARSTERGIR